jgi:hypothetical protein
MPDLYRHGPPHPSPPDLADRIAFLESALAIALMLARQAVDARSVSSGFQPGDPNPDLFTEEEAIRYLRLDTIDIKNRDETLQRYRKERHLKGTQVSKRVFYQRKNLDEFLDRMTEVRP